MTTEPENVMNIGNEYEHRVAHAHEYIECLSFGYNDDNTCSAIALSQALNYLTLQHDRDLVPEEWRSRKRKGTIPVNREQVGQDYSGTDALHRYFVETCGMGAVSYGDKVTVPLRQYATEILHNEAGLELKWTLFPKMKTIEENIDRDLPVLITTTLAGDLSWHTMLCYGYRRNPVSGKAELLVHNGWYGPKHTVRDPMDGTARQAETWINKRLATYGYYFTLKQ